jgi:hypothetical protein
VTAALQNYIVFLPHIKTRLRISERPKKWKKEVLNVLNQKKKEKREKKKLLLPF